MGKRGYSAGWYDYREHEVVLKRWVDDSSVESEEERISFEWYFYLQEKDEKKLTRHSELVGLVDDLQETGDGWFRVYSNSNRDDRRFFAEMLREVGIEPYEMDVSPLNRFLTDNPIQFADSLRVLYYDLETDARKGWDHIPEHRVLSVAWHDHRGKTKCLLADRDDDTGEGDLLEKFLDVVDQHDLVVAWNGDAYDEIVMRARTKYQGIRYRWARINFLDQMLLFKRYFARDARASGVRVSFALDNIARTVLGRGKLKDVKEYGSGNIADRIVWAFHHKPKLLKKYNKRDVNLQVELEEKEKHIEAHRVMSNLCNRFLSSWALRTGYLGDAFVLRYGGEVGQRFPTKTSSFNKDSDEWKKRLDKQIKGAYVMDPEVGLHENVQLVDFASLYPSIMRTFNISPETVIKGEPEDGVPYCIAANGACFRTDRPGIFPQIVKLAVEKRSPWKKKVKELEKAGKDGTDEYTHAKHVSDAYKVLSNTMYGILAAVYLRFYDPECGEAVTLTGQHTLKLVESVARRLGIPTLYGDTDSDFVQCLIKRVPGLIEAVAGEVDEWVRSMHGEPGHIRLEHDASYDRILFIAKKRYAGVKAGSEEMDVKGLELMRTDGCRLAREMQRRILEYILLAPNPRAEIAERILIKWQDDLFERNVDLEDLVITQAIQKTNLDEYKAKQPHIEVARWMLENGREVYPGMKVRYLITGREGNKKSGRLQAVSADEPGADYDPQLYWEKKIFPATERCLVAAWPEWDWAALTRRSVA